MATAQKGTNKPTTDWQQYQNQMQAAKNQAAQSGDKAAYDKYNQEIYRVSTKTGVNPTVAKAPLGSNQPSNGAASGGGSGTWVTDLFGKAKDALGGAAQGVGNAIGGALNTAANNMAAIAPQVNFMDMINKQAMDAVNAQIAAQTKALQDQLAQSQLAFQQQDTALQNQLKENVAGLQKIGNQNAFRIGETENRFGGTYSGGARLQQAANDQSINEGIGNLQRDTQSRSANLWAQYGQLAQQAREKIAGLAQQTPQMVQDYITRALGNAQAIGGLTGMTPWGTPTYSAQQDQQARDWDQFTYFNDIDIENERESARNEAAMAEAEAKQLQEQRQYFVDLVNASDKLGYVVPELAQFIGVKPYSSTLSAETQIADAAYKMGMLDVAQQNADTSAKNANTNAKSAQNASDRLAFDKEKADKPENYNYKTDPDFQDDYAFVVMSPDEARSTLQAQASDFIKKYGVDGYNELKAALPKVKAEE